MRTCHSSRSRYEAFNRCMRYGVIQYAWDGRGVVKAGKDVAMTTGIWIHWTLEQVFKWLLKHKAKEISKVYLDHIIAQMRQGYYDYVFPEEERKKGVMNGFILQERGMDEFDEYEKQPKEFTDLEKQRIQQMTFNEQTALVEALTRVFVKLKLPEWMAEHRIVMVERDISFPLVNSGTAREWEVIQSATIDLVLQHEATKELFVVNYKGLKRYDARTEKGYSHDTQGLSESWAFEEYLRSIGKPRQVDGVKMLFLLKGDRRESKKGSGIWITHSPLIRGYRKLEFDGPNYAHSLYFSKPENDSGIGRLGKGWEPLEVFQGAGFQEVGGVEGWLQKLEVGDIQPECGNILEEQLVEPIPFNRQKGDIDSWLVQTKYREAEIATKLCKVYDGIEAGSNLVKLLDENFHQNHNACHYPTDCEYIPICYGTEQERSSPLQNGYVYRTPHHKAELEQIKGGKG